MIPPSFWVAFAATFGRASTDSSLGTPIVYERLLAQRTQASVPCRTRLKRLTPNTATPPSPASRNKLNLSNLLADVDTQREIEVLHKSLRPRPGTLSINELKCDCPAQIPKASPIERSVCYLSSTALVEFKESRPLDPPTTGTC
jgi:hypothetical protein